MEKGAGGRGRRDGGRKRNRDGGGGGGGGGRKSVVREVEREGREGEDRDGGKLQALVYDILVPESGTRSVRQRY